MTPVVGPDERTQRGQQEATMRSIDETRENVKRAIEEARRETPRFAQTVTEFQNETADAIGEISSTFLESQKEVIISMQSPWIDVSERAGMMQSWNYYWWLSPMFMAHLYARMAVYMTEALAVNTRAATNMIFSGLETTRATTRYVRESSKEMSRIISVSARAASQTARESLKVQGKAAHSAGIAGASTMAEGAATS